jgi:hypothetical protein
MDPNALLAEIRDYQRDGYGTRPLAEITADLDRWLSKGGFLPAAWIKQPAEPTPIPQKRDGQTADGRPYKVIENSADASQLYPKRNEFQFGCWPVLVLETGGYNDIEATDPWTGRSLWVGQIWDDSATPVAGMLRLLADTIEESGFGTTD